MSQGQKRGYGSEEYSEETLADLIAQLESTQKEVSIRFIDALMLSFVGAAI